MEGLARVLERVNDEIGRIIAWTAFAMVIAQFIIVLFVAIFRIGGLVPMEESVLYYHSVLFLLGAGYTLIRDGHVRVDIFYREASPKRKRLVDLLGLIFFLFPVCAAFIWYSWPFMLQAWDISNAPGLQVEGSREPHGLHLVFILKTFVFVFAIMLTVQAVALLLRNILAWRGDLPDHWSPTTERSESL